MEILILFAIALSLSMDAFSLSLAYGTLNLPRKNIKILSLIVGIYHFIMPMIGLIIGSYIFGFIKIYPNLIVLIILFIIGLQMIISKNDDKEIKSLSIIEMIMFGFAVSLDSLSIGITLPTISDKTLVACFIFSVCSAMFTYLGLFLGKTINSKIGRYSTKLGGLALIIIGILFIL